MFCLSSSCVLCAQCCQYLWIVHSWLPLWFSLTFILYIFDKLIFVKRLRYPVVHFHLFNVFYLIICSIKYYHVCYDLSVITIFKSYSTDDIHWTHNHTPKLLHESMLSENFLIIVQFHSGSLSIWIEKWGIHSTVIGIYYFHYRCSQLFTVMTKYCKTDVCQS